MNGSLEDNKNRADFAQTGDFYFFPTREGLNIQDSSSRFQKKDKARGDAIEFAEIVGKSHHILTKAFGRIPEDYYREMDSREIAKYYSWDREYVEGEIEALVKASGKSYEELITYIEESLQYEGVLLLINNSVLKDGTLREGDMHGDMRINVKGRALSSFCSGVVFMSKADERLFETLIA